MDVYTLEGLLVIIAMSLESMAKGAGGTYESKVNVRERIALQLRELWELRDIADACIPLVQAASLACEPRGPYSTSRSDTWMLKRILLNARLLVCHSLHTSTHSNRHFA